ncbi:hypothetical protein DL765_003287 [Monosporascus sp. GIB2]|nr:hypothetical protein DL765_003287 [Monosporascus sp. GIB2]
MPSQTLEYPEQPYSKVNRYNDRASYSLETIHHIINTSPVLHVSFNTPDSPFPTILPMIGQMGSFSRPSADTGDVLDLYLHGYVSSQIMNLARGSGGKDGDGDVNNKERGLPLSVAATHVDGLVLSLTPNSHSYNYRSAVVFGRAVPVTDAAEKLWAMELITNGVVRDRWRHTRVPPTSAEMQSTAVLRVTVAAGSAKIRTGMPCGENRDDAGNPALAARVWTGVVPFHLVAEEPKPAPGNGVAQVPAYLGEYVADFNARAKKTALEAATTPMEPKQKSGGD